MKNPQAGDRIEIESETVGTPAREGEILEVIQGEISVRYRIRWGDGHESVMTPSGGTARIIARTGKKAVVKKPTKKPKGR
jgi:hypothetical protein